MSARGRSFSLPERVALNDPPRTSTTNLLRRALAAEGLRGALRFISERTQHRFLGVYCFDEPMLRTRGFYDREDPSASPPDDIPIMSSYCVFVREGGATFMVDDAAADERVADHPKRRQLLSYCGVPLLDADGQMFGTVCLYDVVARSFQPGDIELLEQLGPLLATLPGVGVAPTSTK